MEKFKKTFEIDFDGNTLFIAEENSTGYSCEVNNKRQLLDRIVDYVMEEIDPEFDYCFEIIKRKK